jgi:hypothetical protein
MRFWEGASITKGASPRSPSLDRIRPDGHYALGNVRVVLLGLNSLRGAGTDQEMRDVAAALLAHTAC